jgi:hypothetical protein
MGLSGGTTTTTKNSTQNVQLPEWVNQGSQDVFKAAGDWAKTNQQYTPYAGDRTADFGSSWDPAKGWITDQIGASNPDIDASRNSINSVLGQLDPNKSVADRMNPYLQGVLNPQLRSINEAFDKQRGNLAASATSAGAFGDNSHAMEKALLNRDQGIATGEATGRAYSDAFGNAQSQQNQVLQQIMAAAQGQAGLGNQQYQQNMGTANAAAGMGATEQGVEQKGVDSQIADFVKAQGWTGEQATRMAQILAMLPTNKTVTGTEKSTAPDNSGMALLGSVLSSII